MEAFGAMKLTRVPIDKLNPAAYNPRKMTEQQLAGLSESIERFGLVEPIVWNKRSGNVVGGHQRLAVIKAQGFSHTDVVAVDLNEKDEKALNVTLNNRHIQGDWDDGLLQGLLREILSEGGLEKTEFDSLRLDELYDPLADIADDGVSPDLDEGLAPDGPVSDDAASKPAAKVRSVHLYVPAELYESFMQDAKVVQDRLGLQSISEVAVECIRRVRGEDE